MRHRGALSLLVAVPLLLAACGDDGGEPSKPHQGGGAEKVFDEKTLEGPDGVRRVLESDYSIQGIQSVSCPAGQKEELGNQFECTATVGGTAPSELKAVVTVVSDDGTYKVSLPEPE